MNYPGYAFNLDAQHLRGSESGLKSRANLTWHVMPDVMVYYTFSQGFRPGGFNGNGSSSHVPGPDGVTQYLIPRSYSSDKLTNNEIGWKTEFFDHRLQWNGAIYRENWDNVQIEFFDPGLIGNLYVNTNGQNFLIKGIETSLIGACHRRSDAAGLRVLEPEPADEFARVDRQQPGERQLRQAHHRGLRLQPVARPWATPSARSDLRARMRRRSSSACAHATTGPSQRLQPVRAGSAHHNGHSFTQAGSNPNYRHGRCGLAPRARDSRFPPTRPSTPPPASRRTPGRSRVRGESRQFERQHVHQHRPVHRRADAAAAAGHRRIVQLLVLRIRPQALRSTGVWRSARCRRTAAGCAGYVTTLRRIGTASSSVASTSRSMSAASQTST